VLFCKLFYRAFIYHGFFFEEFEDGLNQRLATNTDAERTDWSNCLISASCDFMRAKLKYLREEIEKKRGATHVDVDVEMLRSKTGKEIGESFMNCLTIIFFHCFPHRTGTS
jgi:hypothetical protein